MPMSMGEFNNGNSTSPYGSDANANAAANRGEAGPGGGGGLSREDSASSSADAGSGAAAAGGGGGRAGSSASGGAPSEGGSDFEASLLLGIATESTSAGASSASNAGHHNHHHHTDQHPSSGKERREPIDPTTLPTSMTSFLDMLTEDQRRVRHRHIPGVEGFRKLYRNEVKADMGEARRIKRTSRQNGGSREGSERGGGGGGSVAGDDAMEVDKKENENEGEGEKIAGAAASASANAAEGNKVTETNEKKEEVVEDELEEEEEEEEEKGVLDREVFVAPCKDALACARGGQLASLVDSTDFERDLRGSGGVVSAPRAKADPDGAGSGAAVAAPSLRSPRLVDSLTSFHPPRPQESTAPKTRHRLKRWEANPAEVDADLANYRRTVTKTRAELHAARGERERIEAVASMAREHFRGHLTKYRGEALAANEALQEAREGCARPGEEDHHGGRRGGAGASRGMRMAEALAALESLGVRIASADATARAAAEGSVMPPEDWRVPGVGGVAGAPRAGTRAADDRRKPAVASGWFLVGDGVIVASTGERGAVAKIRPPGITKDSGGGADAMDDSPGKEGSRGRGNMPSGADLRAKVGVMLAGKPWRGVVYFEPSELRFDSENPLRIESRDPALAKRWRCMAATALGTGAVDHDFKAMGAYIDSVFAKERAARRDGANADDGGEDKKDKEKDGDDKDEDPEGGGGSSPKSVARFEDEPRGLLPFGAGLFAAPMDVRDYPSVIPMDDLEATVRRVAYETKGPRVMPTFFGDAKKYEAQQEEANALRGWAMQLRNRLSRQKRLRVLNERSLAAGRSRSHKVEGLLLEMQMDLKNLKERLQDELNELGIGNSPLPSITPEDDLEEGDETEDQEEDEATPKDEGDPLKEVEKGRLDVSMAEGNTGGGGGNIALKDAQQAELKDVAVKAGNGDVLKKSLLTPETKGVSPVGTNPSANDLFIGPNSGIDNLLEPESKRPRIEE